MNTFPSFITEHNDIVSISGQCIIHPTQENNLLCCYRTTIVSKNVHISFDGYDDKSSFPAGASSKAIMDSARASSIEQVKNAWNFLSGQPNQKDTVIDVTAAQTIEQKPTTAKQYDIVPDNYRTNKYNEPMTDKQNSVVYSVAKLYGMTPEEFARDKLGKSAQDLTKGEVRYLSETYGEKKNALSESTPY